MANRGFNGTIIVGGQEGGDFLVQSGKHFQIHRPEEVFKNLGFLLDTAVENEDEFLQWYNIFDNGDT